MNKTLKHEGGSISIDNNKLSNINIKEIYCTIKGETRDYWQKVLDLALSTMELINWEPSGKAFNSLRSAKQRRIIKHLTDNAPAGNNMKKWKFLDVTTAPTVAKIRRF